MNLLPVLGNFRKDIVMRSPDGIALNAKLTPPAAARREIPHVVVEHGHRAGRRNRGRFPGWRSGWGWGDQGCELWDFRAWDLQSGAEVIEERDFELGAGLGEAEHDVAGDASSFADGSAGDFSFGD